MMNKRWFRLAGWLLTLVMMLTVIPAATFAEEETGNQTESDVFQFGAELLEVPTEVDITGSVSFSLTDAKGKAVEAVNMNPNDVNWMKLTISGLESHEEIGNDTIMTVTIPEDVSITETGLKEFSNNTVAAALNGGKLNFTWKGEKQDSLEATFAVLPHIPAAHDLSGSYVLGTARKSMLGTRAFRDKEKTRDKLYASEFTVTDSGIRPATDENPVWVLEHVSGDYYTLRAQNTNKYIYISPAAKGAYLANSLYLVEGTSETAQKILVTNVGDGYYSFTYTHTDGKKYSINNSGNDKEGNSALRGFGCWTYDNLPNEKFKLYSPSALDNRATFNLSGDWVIASTAGKVSLTSESSEANRLNGMTYSLNNGFTISDDDPVIFTFEHVIRDWYTVKTDAGYLDITADGVKISSSPKRLMVQTDDHYANVILTTGEYLNSTDKVCSTYALNFAGNKLFGSVLSKYTANTRMQLVSPSGFANGQTAGFLMFDSNGGTNTEVPRTISGLAGEKILLPEMSGTKEGQEFIGWADVKDIYARVSGMNHTYHAVYTPGTSYTMKAGVNTLYAVYNAKNRTVQFGIRGDGVIQDEPNSYDVKGYKGHFKVDGILKEGRWVIDIDSTKPINDYYMANNVTASLNWVPSAEEIAAALMKDGKISFDPESQYIHYYVLKYTGTEWHVDGVIRNKANVGINYETNVPTGVDKTKVTNMPGGYQVTPGTDILIGADQNSDQIKRPGLQGYFFVGWNTKADGTGAYYDENDTIHLTENLLLYAQWVSKDSTELVIRIHSDWTMGRLGYVGARITLFAELTGFEDRIYTLQWQYTTDPEKGEWIDVPGAHDITYTYTLNEETTQYTWRVIAQDIR